jgi:hypothetical protein
MNGLSRRGFLKAAAAASAAAAAGAGARATVGGRDFLELRAYRLRAGAPRDLLDSYLEKAFIPAANARGVGAVGVFTEPPARDGAAVWVLAAHPSAESVASVAESMNSDPAVRAAGEKYLGSPTVADPAFDRIDSWLLV